MGRALPVRRAWLVALAFAAACGWHGPQAAQSWPEVKVGETVQAMDAAAYKLVAVQAFQAVPEADGRLKLTLELANLSDTDLPVQVQTIFRDAAGMLVGDETGWQMLVLPGNGSARYEVGSLKPHPGAYTVQIKTP